MTFTCKGFKIILHAERDTKMKQKKFITDRK